MHSVNNIQFPVTFTEENCNNLDDQKVIYSLQIVHYLRQQLPTYLINIQTIKSTELRIGIMKPNEFRINDYRIKLSPKENTETSFLTGGGKSVCKGFDNFIEHLKK